jgi:NAD(P)-dependent dehydrogenase (short-subunit alcohol dehydrogenase family)
MELNNTMSAVVTGGASGLGAATARMLASHGVKVALFDLNEELGEALAKEINGIFCPVNVTSDADVDAGLAKARAANGQERILINCAGVGGSVKTVSRDRETGEIKEYPLENFERIININLIGTFRCITKSAAGMLSVDPLDDGDRGVVINTASVAAVDGQIGQAAYSASKAGVVGMTLTVARDLSREGIRVLAVSKLGSGRHHS